MPVKLKRSSSPSCLAAENVLLWTIWLIRMHTVPWVLGTVPKVRVTPNYSTAFHSLHTDDGASDIKVLLHAEVFWCQFLLLNVWSQSNGLGSKTLSPIVKFLPPNFKMCVITPVWDCFFHSEEEKQMHFICRHVGQMSFFIRYLCTKTCKFQFSEILWTVAAQRDPTENLGNV